MTTISDGIVTITPTLVEGYSSARASSSRVHRIIGRADPDVTLSPAATRSGKLTLLFESEADASAAEIALAAPAVWTLADDDRLTLGMTFTLDEGGEITRELDDESRDLWHIAFPFVEVAP